MIWRTAHPVRGLVAAILVLLILAVLLGGFGGFAVGWPELLIMVLLAAVAFAVASRGKSANERSIT